MPRRLLRRRVPGVHDPAVVFDALLADRTDVFWLDAGSDGVSYLGAGERWEPASPVLPRVRAELARTALEAADADGPVGGLVGWFASELRAETIGLPAGPGPGSSPPAAFLRVGRLVAISAAGELELRAPSDDPGAEEWFAATIRDLAQSRPSPSRAEEAVRPPSRSPRAAPIWRTADADYRARILAAQRRIRDGDVYQLCLTTEVAVPGAFDPVAVHRRLRTASPSHHGALIRIGRTALVSASPERFLEVAPDGAVATHPIKGTRPRGADAAADAALAAELVASEKERAENLMIVDLMRNDLARVCALGSVTVTRLHAVESYPAVHQLVSTVTGRLRPDADALDAFAACFPAGSMTGAPKRRAIELLDGLEQRRRGLYAGAFGYLGADGRVDLAMTIRTIVLTPDGATIGTGGGITALSDPDAEVAEIHLKAAALLAALDGPSSPAG